MKAKDISDQEFLDAVEVAATLRGSDSAYFHDIRAVLSGFPEDIRDLNEDHKDLYLPYKLVRAKARKLVRRDKLKGTIGDWFQDYQVVTEAMREERRLKLKMQDRIIAGGELENKAREWRMRDEKIQYLQRQVDTIDNDGSPLVLDILEGLQQQIAQLSTYTIVTKRGNNDDVPMGQG